MSLLHDSDTDRTSLDEDDAPVDRPTRDRPLTAETDTVDLTDDEHRATAAPGRHDDRPVHGPVEIDPSGRIPWRGMRIRRVRLASVAKLSFVFWLIAFAVLLGSAVVVWNVARAFGFVTEFEDVVVTSLGLDSFAIDGGALFGIAAVAVAFVSVLGWIMTILMAAVYNASCAVFGGLAVETGPIQRRRRVFSLRHRGFVTIRS